MCGISYYKAYIPQQIKILPKQLNQSQKEFFDKIYKNGLGEFFYINKIDFRELINFPYPE